MPLLATLLALFGVADDTSTGVPALLWIILVVLLIICAIVYLVRRTR